MPLKEEDLLQVKAMWQEETQAHDQALLEGIGKVMDARIEQGITRAIQQLTEVSEKLSAAQQGEAQGQAQPGVNLLASVLPSLVQLFTTLKAPAANAGLNLDALNQIASTAEVINKMFLAPYMSAFQGGMAFASNMYTYAVRATGETPDAAKIAQQADGAGKPA